MPKTNNINMASGTTKKIERLISIFQFLTRTKFNVKKHEHRLKLQKIAYILQIRDKSFNYLFNWFVRGPYSPQLTREEYEYRESEANKLTNEDKKNAEFVKILVEETSESNLELFASVYYLMKTRRIREFEDIYFTIHSLKPWFDKEEVRKVFYKINSQM